MSKDPHIAHLFSAEEEDCLSLEQMTAYQEGRLAGGEKHLVERHLLNCELCGLTYESMVEHGAESLAVGAQEVAERAWEHVQAREQRKRRGAIFWIATAASVALLITVGYFGLRGPTDVKMGRSFERAMRDTHPLSGHPGQQGGIAMNREWGGEGMPTSKETKNPPSPVQDGSKDAMTTDDFLSKGAPMDGDDFAEASGKKRDNQQARLEMAKPVPSPSRPSPTGGATPPTQLNTTPTLAGSTTMAEDQMRFSPVSPAKEETSMAKGGKGAAKDRTGNKEDGKKGISLDDNGYAVMDGRGAGEDKEMDMMEAEETDAPNHTLLNEVVVASEKKEERNAKSSVKTKQRRESVAPTAPNADAEPRRALQEPPALNAYEDGIAAYQQGNYRDAATYLRKATEITPNNLQAHLYAADAYLRIEQPQAALFHIERILAVPGNSVYEDAEWYKALAYLQLKEGRKAQRQLETVITRNGRYKVRAEAALKELE